MLEEPKKRQNKLRIYIWSTVAVLVLVVVAPMTWNHFQIPAPDRNLMSAVKDGNVDAVRGALSRGGNPNRHYRSGKTPLHVAAWDDEVDIARLLIRGGANVNSRDHEAGETPLHTAARANNPRMTTMLMMSGANGSLTNFNETEEDASGNRHPPGMTARQIAEASGHNEVLRRLRGD